MGRLFKSILATLLAISAFVGLIWFVFFIIDALASLYRYALGFEKPGSQIAAVFTIFGTLIFFMVTTMFYHALGPKSEINPQEDDKTTAKKDDPVG